MRQDHERATEMFRESLVLCLKLGDKLVAVESLEGMACIAGLGEKPSGGASVRDGTRAA